jgi:hypothetical protein
MKKNRKKNLFYGRTDRQTDGQPKTIVRNLTKSSIVSKAEQDKMQKKLK